MPKAAAAAVPAAKEKLKTNELLDWLSVQASDVLDATIALNRLKKEAGPEPNFVDAARLRKAERVKRLAEQRVALGDFLVEIVSFTETGGRITVKLEDGRPELEVTWAPDPSVKA